jgi:hypothetical protein
MSVRGDDVVRWQACQAGHLGKLPHDLYRQEPAEAHSLEERETCEDQRCAVEAKRTRVAWLPSRFPEQDGDIPDG